MLLAIIGISISFALAYVIPWINEHNKKKSRAYSMSNDIESSKMCNEKNDNV